jgi:hypothetical protein
MKFCLPLIAVDNVQISKVFYQDLFDQTVVMDLGKNITMSGGFALQEGFDWLTGIDPINMIKKSNNMELYFEADDFDAFINKLESYRDIDRVHPVKKYDWQQRVIRIYDPDKHIIEIGESMAVIAKRYLKDGSSAEETAKLIQHPLEFVLMCQQESDQ